jgi:hypothetical protein
MGTTVLTTAFGMLIACIVGTAYLGLQRQCVCGHICSATSSLQAARVAGAHGLRINLGRRNELASVKMLVQLLLAIVTFLPLLYKEIGTAHQMLTDYAVFIWTTVAFYSRCEQSTQTHTCAFRCVIDILTDVLLDSTHRATLPCSSVAFDG